jgi:hypothetical protein
MFDLSRDKKSLNNTGLSHFERDSECLNPDYFSIDEMDLDQFIHFVSNYSRLLSFYNDQNKLQGDWSTFFVQDPTFAVLRLSTIKTKELNRVLLKELIEARKSRSQSIKERTLIVQGQELLTLLVAVEQNLIQLSSYNSLHTELVKIISVRMSISLTRLLVILEQYIGEALTESIKGEFGNYWFTTDFDTYAEIKESDLSPIDLHLAETEELALSAIRVLDVVAATAQEYFDKNLATAGEMSPHIALLLTFRSLYSEAASELNKLTKKHLDHYYREILRIKPQENDASFVHVNFEVSEGQGAVEIQKGDKLIAGLAENGEDILFEVQETKLVHELNIEEAILIQRGGAEQVLLPFKNFEAEKRIFRLGGARQKNNTEQKDADIKDGSIGFKFGSEILYLEEGYRKITFEFQSSGKSFQKFLFQLENLLLIEEMEPNAFNAILERAFNVEYSTEGEMISIAHDRVECTINRNATGDWKNSFEILVFIDTIDPAINTLEEANDAEEKKEYPFFQFMIDAGKMDLYAAFNELEIENIEVEAEIIDVKNLLLSNDFGPLDPTSPFEPFGSQPNLGAGFYIGHQTMFNYPVLDLKLSLEWQGLPGTDGGFDEHYKAYHEIEGNESFKVKISALRDKRWFPVENKQVMDLFVTTNPEEDRSVSPMRRMNEISTRHLEIDKRNSQEKKVTEFSPQSLYGFVKMELCYPLVAFGHDQYPELVTNAAMVSAKSKKLLPFPNEPYIPVLKSISGDFIIKRSYNLKSINDFMFRQVHPFGEQEITSTDELLPKYKEGSNLMLGLNHNSDNQIISMLFQLNPEYSADKSDDTVHEWSVWNDSGWIKLNPSEITADTTLGFRKSGIIELNIERGAFDTTSLFTPNLIWLKCESASGHNFLEGILDVVPNCVLAKCINPELLEEPNIDPQQIKSLQQDKVGLSVILQKYGSFGGRRKEKDLLFYRRISERLRHKDRAVSIRDYESLLLEQFKDLYRVKCFANTDENLEIAPGQVLVTVIPKLSSNDKGRLILKYFSKVELTEMKEFLERRMPLGVKVNITNPIYEKIRTKFNVRFRDGFDSTFYIKRMNDDIRSYLSPFLSKGEEQMMFGKSIQSTRILNFMDKLEYVDYVVNFSVYHVVNDVIVNHNAAVSNSLELIPTSGISILVSDDNHKISLHDDENYTDVFGINEMMIETDYIVEEQDEDESKNKNLVIGKNYRIIGTKDEITKESSTFALYINLD